TPPVALGMMTGHDTCAHQRLHVVSKQVRRDIEHPGELCGGGITDLEAVDDPETHWITERCVHLGPAYQLRLSLNLH
ncbi:hypothetical protein AB0F44_15260, partial [Nocardioides sp. NPDC023903]|uniref:hypothetical protein n=1 Tax=Nocardioides sp. NPDC023903 TaxID=3157195 RepID=UPI003405923A